MEKARRCISLCRGTRGSLSQPMSKGQEMMNAYQEDLSIPGPPVDESIVPADMRLVDQLRREDTEAGRRFVREYYPGVYRYLLYLTGRREAAEDLAQETFLQAWSSLGAFEGR